MSNKASILPFSLSSAISLAPSKSAAKKPLTSAFLRGFLEGAKRKGHDLNTILKRAHIDPSLINDANATFDGKQLQDLIIAITEQLDDLYMGFVKDRYKPVLNYAVMNVALGSDTLGESIRARIGVRESIRDDVHYEFQVNKKASEFILSLTGFDLVEGVDPHLFYWLRLSTIYRYHSWLIGQRIKLNRIDFASPETQKYLGQEPLAHLAMFGCEVRFNQAQTAITYDNKYLSQPIIRTDRETLQGVAIEHYDDWLEVPGSDLSMVRQVEQVLETQQNKGIFHPSTEDVAKALRITPRSLRNQLSRESASFQQIKARVRQQLAIKKLLASALPISTVADALGFSEPGDFSRNFKRWTGLSPSEYRAKHSKS